jgi:hypothetical protein
MSLHDAIIALLRRYESVENTALDAGDDDAAEQASRRRAILSGWLSYFHAQRRLAEAEGRRKHNVPGCAPFE